MAKLNRRQFLQLSLLLAGSAVLSGCDEEELAETAVSADTAVSTNSDPGQLDVIVVGAGIAGLKAAHDLQVDGYRVLVLEGRDRIGGRIWSNRTVPNMPLDLGASWIHGIDDNPIWDLAQENGLETAVTDYDNYTLYHTDGTAVSDDHQEEIEARLEELITACAELGEELDDDISLQAAFDQVVADLELAPAELVELQYAVNTSLEHEFAADLADMSLFSWDSGAEVVGDDVIFAAGYDQIINLLSTGLPIKLGHVVQKVAYDDRGVRITTNQGVFTAEYAVITLPVGVLKSGAVQFEPPLPAEKQTALAHLGMDVLNKVYLRFAEVFWDEDSEMIGYISAQKGEWCEWLNLAYYTGEPILLGFNAGEYGRFLETLSDAEIIAAAMDTLRTCYGNDIPDPQAVLITRWAADTFARGSYSHLRPGGSEDDYELLAEPVDGRLFFAGEATSADYPATVHGAYLSGERAAGEVG